MSRYRCVQRFVAAGAAGLSHALVLPHLAPPHCTALQIVQSVLHALPVQHTSCRTAPHLISSHLASHISSHPRHVAAYPRTLLHFTAASRASSHVAHSALPRIVTHQHASIADIGVLHRMPPHHRRTASHHTADHRCHCMSAHSTTLPRSLPHVTLFDHPLPAALRRLTPRRTSLRITAYLCTSLICNVGTLQRISPRLPHISSAHIIAFCTSPTAPHVAPVHYCTLLLHACCMSMCPLYTTGTLPLSLHAFIHFPLSLNQQQTTSNKQTRDAPTWASRVYVDILNCNATICCRAV